MAAPVVFPILVSLVAAQAGGFTFEGTRASASTERPEGVFVHGPVPYSDTAERGFGSARLEVTDRLQAPMATYGDQGRLSATFRLGGDTYVVELTQVGFPPARAGATAGPRPPAPAQPIGGGVVLDTPLGGGSGLGFSHTTQVQAAAALWGTGRVLRNGRLLTDTALIHAAALSAGAFADDLTGRTLRTARAGDTELHVVAWYLPVDLEPRGFVQFVFDSVRVEVGGAPVAARDFIDTTQGTGDLASRTPLTPGASALGTAVTQPQPAGQLAGTGGSGRPTDARAAPDSAAQGTPGVATVGQPGPPSGRQSTQLSAATDEQGTPGVATTDQAPQPSTGRQGAAERALPTGTAGAATTTSPGPVAGAQRTRSADAAAAPAGTPGVATTGAAPGAPVLDAQGRAIADTRPGTVPPAGGVVGQGTGGSGVSATQGFGAAATGPTGVSGTGTGATGAAPGTLALPPGGGATTGTALSSSSTTLATAGSFSTPTSGAVTFGAPPTTATASAAPATLATGAGTADVPGARREFSPGLLATPPVAGTTAATSAVPLISTPAPAGSGAAPPLLSTPAPLNSTPPPALPATPAPANAAPAPSPAAGGATTPAPPAPTPAP